VKNKMESFVKGVNPVYAKMLLPEVLFLAQKALQIVWQLDSAQI